MGSGFAPVTPFGLAFQEILAAFDRLEIHFFVGGSVASGTYGLPRQTNDIDMVADIAGEDIPDLHNELSQSFYADEEEIRQAVDRGRSFNLIHLKSAFKFDIFPVGSNRFARSELLRRRYTTASVPGIENIEFPVASAEDTILSKLVWFRKGGSVSERQWQDIQGVIRVQVGRLDHIYLDKWAAELGVVDLLAKAISLGSQPDYPKTP